MSGEAFEGHPEKQLPRWRKELHPVSGGFLGRILRLVPPYQDIFGWRCIAEMLPPMNVF
jgi:hypothetical protein